MVGGSAAPPACIATQWKFGQTCGCAAGCGSGTCNCGTCSCLPGTGGPTCNSTVDCFGNITQPGQPVAQVDVCGVCGGDGKSCLGCDGTPHGPTYDKCGVCGGYGSTCFQTCFEETCSKCTEYGEGCVWCASSGTCLDKVHSVQCNVTVYNETGECPTFLGLNTLDTGLSLGAIAGITIGAAVGLAILIFGGKKGYDYYHKLGTHMDGTQNNPMYKDPNTGGNNPFYADDGTKA